MNNNNSSTESDGVVRQYEISVSGTCEVPAGNIDSAEEARQLILERSGQVDIDSATVVDVDVAGSELIGDFVCVFGDGGSDPQHDRDDWIIGDDSIVAWVPEHETHIGETAIDEFVPTTEVTEISLRYEEEQSIKNAMWVQNGEAGCEYYLSTWKLEALAEVFNFARVVDVARRTRLADDQLVLFNPRCEGLVAIAPMKQDETEVVNVGVDTYDA